MILSIYKGREGKVLPRTDAEIYAFRGSVFKLVTTINSAYYNLLCIAYIKRRGSRGGCSQSGARDSRKLVGYNGGR